MLKRSNRFRRPAPAGSGPDGPRPARARPVRTVLAGGVLPGPLALAVAVGAGLLLFLAFPRFDLWYLAPLGVGSLVVAVSGRSARSAAGLGFATGLAQCLPHLAWTGVYVGLIAWIPLAAACAAFTALAAAMIAWGERVPAGPRLAPLLAALTAAGSWTACEGFLARFPFGGFGWTRLAFSQADAPTLGLAALGGAPLVSFAVALAGALAARALLVLVRSRTGHSTDLRTDGRPGRRRALATAALVLAALVVELGGALVPRPTAAQAGRVDVAGVQGNVPRLGLDFNAQRRAVLDDHARESLRLVDQVAAGTRPAPQLVVWPENSSDIDPLTNADAGEEIAAVVDQLDAPLLLGTLHVRPDGKILNTSLLWEPGKGPVASYVKRHPVPFGEYIPYRSFFRRITKKVDLVRADFAPGTRVGRIDAPVAGTPGTAGRTVRLGTLICFEVVDDHLVADTVDHGADLLVVQTNNATFGRTDESVQQLAMSRVRAVEHGRAVVHVSTVGRSALVMPDGSLRQETRLFTPALLQAELPLRTSLTVADRLRAHHVPVEGLLVALGALGALTGGLRPLLARRRRESTEHTLREDAP